MSKEVTHNFCTRCQKDYKVKDFYKSFNYDIHPNGYINLCKKCANELVPDFNDVEALKSFLMMVNKPFIHHLYLSAKTKPSHMGEYFKLINAKDYRHCVWSDSIFEPNKNDFNVHTETQLKEIDNTNRVQFVVTNEMLMRWGQNYSVDDYIKLEDFYHKMKDMNRIETPQEETYLKKLAVISLKMDQELENGNYNQVKQLGDLFSKYMADSKFRAMDKSEADKTGGIRTFSTIFEEVEKDGHIPPWEQYRKIKGIKQDLVDKTIMHIENFILRLNKIERMTEPPSDTPKIEDLS